MQEPARLLEDEIQNLATVIGQGVEITIWHLVSKAAKRLSDAAARIHTYE